MKTGQRPHYKYYIGITSQISFCQVPLRLDAFNQCAFSCSYCFASARAGNRGPRKLQVAKSQNLRERFCRLQDGVIASAVDEFLVKRIPIQLGGMTDPFSDLERRHSSSLGLLEALNERSYPTLISTKSAMLLQQQYSDIVCSGNFLMRFSLSIVEERSRRTIEKGTPSLKDVLRVIEGLSSLGGKCSVRFQPVIPGHEHAAFGLTKRVKEAGARHVTFEYLKLPTDDLKNPICHLKAPDGEETLIDFYRRKGAKQQGRELVLPMSYKIGFLSEISKFAREEGLSVGFGDNEFLPYGDGMSCCNGADLYLRDLSLFKANPAAVIRGKKRDEAITFADLISEWTPLSSINTYLNSRVRVPATSPDLQWHSYWKKHWRIGSIYGPDFFYGVKFAGISDREGMPIFSKGTDTL